MERKARKPLMLAVAIIDPRELMRKALCKLFLSVDQKSAFLPVSAAKEIVINEDSNIQTIVLHAGAHHISCKWVRHELSVMKATDIPSVALCDSDSGAEVAEAMSLGARGYILTNLSPEVAVGAMKIVAAGGEFIPASALLNDTGGEPVVRRPHENKNVENPAEYISFLTWRERAVLKHLYEGNTNKDIGKILGIAPATVKAHVLRIMKKLKATNRTQACAAALELVNRLKNDKSRESNGNHGRVEPFLRLSQYCCSEESI